MAGRSADEGGGGVGAVRAVRAVRAVGAERGWAHIGSLFFYMKTRTKGSQVGTMAETEPRAARWG